MLSQEIRCEHTFVYREGLDKKGSPFKVEICSKCGVMQDVIIKEDIKNQTAKIIKKEPPTGRCISRMSVLKCATDLAIEMYGQSEGLVAHVQGIAEELEDWIYRPVEE